MKKKVLAAIQFVVLFSIAVTMIPIARSQNEEWSEPEQLTIDPLYDDWPSIMQDSSGKIWVVWARNPGDLWYMTSSDEGASWSTPQMLVADTLHSVRTCMLQDSNGRIWVAWGSGQYSPYVEWDIFYITSDDGGLSWSAPTQLTNYPGDDDVSSLIEVAGEIWIVFRSSGLSSSENIWYRKTADGGVTWSDPIPITSTGRNYTPCAYVDSTGKIWIVWHRHSADDDIYYKTSIDNGVSWSEEQELVTQPISGGGKSIVEDSSGKIFIFYSVFGHPADIWYKTTADSGNTWSDPQELIVDEHANGCAYAALIDKRIWVVFESDRSGNMEIWMTMTALKVTASVNVDPDTLNLKSNGQWITAYITLPEGHNVEDIVLETVYLDGIAAAWSEIQCSIYVAKFDRAAVQIHVTHEPDYESAPKFCNVILAVTGQLVDGTIFEGTDTIRIISK